MRAAELRERLVRVACTHSTEAPGRGVGEVGRCLAQAEAHAEAQAHTPKLSLSLSLSLSLGVALGVAGGEPKLSQTLSQS